MFTFSHYFKSLPSPRADRLPQLQTNISNCLLDISNWRSARHLLLNISKEKATICHGKLTIGFPVSLKGFTHHQAKTCESFFMLPFPSAPLPQSLSGPESTHSPELFITICLACRSPAICIWVIHIDHENIKAFHFSQEFGGDYNTAPEQKNVRPYFLTIVPKLFFFLRQNSHLLETNSSI